MRFYHLSDILIGNNSESGMRWESQRSEEITGSLRNLLSKADAQGVELILVSGGLFAEPPVTSELKMVSELFAAHPGIEIVITAGTRDFVTSYSPVLSFIWPANVHFIARGMKRVVLQGLDTVVLAAADTDGVRELISGERMSGASIALMPDIEDEELKTIAGRMEFAYIGAAGAERGVAREIVKNKIYRPGHFEPDGTDDRGAHGVMAGEIDTSAGRLVSAEFVPEASASYVTLRIEINKDTDMGELSDAVAREIARRKAGNIYRLRIIGERDPGLRLDFSELKERWRIRDIIDETRPSYDYEALYKEHSDDMIGYYISALHDREGALSALEEKAMFYGLDALLRTSGSL